MTFDDLFSHDFNKVPFLLRLGRRMTIKLRDSESEERALEQVLVWKKSEYSRNLN